MKSPENKKKRIIDPDASQVVKSIFRMCIEGKGNEAKELIDHIDVYESEGKGKNKTQRIVIYYCFVGYIELPDKIPIVNDTRQGVAVNYISGALSETA